MFRNSFFWLKKDFLTPNTVRISLFSVAILLQSFLLLNHQIWRDESQAWLISHASGNFQELIQNLKYEGHPPGWYLIIWGTSFLVPTYNSIKLIQFFSNLWLFFLLFRDRNLNNRIVFLIVFNFYILVGFGTISRPYTLGICLIYLSIQLAESGAIVVPSLLIISSMFFHVLFIPLGVGVGAFILGRSKAKKLIKYSLISLYVIVSCWIFLLVRPKTDGNFVLSKSLNFSKIYYGIIHFASSSVFPVTSQSRDNFLFVSGVSFTCLFILAIYLFKSNRFLFIAAAISSTFYFCNQLFGYEIAWWHFAVVQFSFLIYLRIDLNSVSNPRRQKSSGLIWLRNRSFLIFALAGLISFSQNPGFSMALNEHYSNAGVVAKYLQKHCFQDCVIVSELDYTSATISAALGGHKIYYLNTGSFGTFTIWKETQYMPPEEVWKSFRKVFGDSCYLVLSTNSKIGSEDTEYLFETHGAIWSDEDFQVRRCVHA